MPVIARLLATDPEIDDVLAWHWREWGPNDATADRDNWRRRLMSRSGAAGIPFTLLAQLEGKPVGCVTV